MTIERDIYQEIKPYLSHKQAIVITGMRRTGKTTLLQHIHEKIGNTNTIFLDLENTLNRKYFEEEDYERIRMNFEVLGLNFEKPAYIFLDEIQFVKNLPSVVKYVSDHYEVKFFLTGSSSFYLKNLFTESLAGRKYVFELFPLNFAEFLRLKGESLRPPADSSKITKAGFQTYDRLYDEFVRFGGFPGVVAQASVNEKKKALEEIFSSYFQLEVVGLGDFKKTSKIRDLILLLMQRAGSKIDIQKLSSELEVSRPTIYEYLSFLEGTYFIQLLKPYSKNRDVQLRGGEKVYICDSGLLGNIGKVSNGALFENNVFQLLRPCGELNYYQKSRVKEVDFIVQGQSAYEVKLHATKQDVSTLVKTSAELKMKKSAVISRAYSPLEQVIYGFCL